MGTGKYPDRNSTLKSVSTQEEILSDSIDTKQDENLKRMYYANMYKNMQKNSLCKVMNIDNELVNLPSTYPGNEWVHSHLVAQRDRPVESFDNDELKMEYNKYRQMCQ